MIGHSHYRTTRTHGVEKKKKRREELLWFFFSFLLIVIVDKCSPIVSRKASVWKYWFPCSGRRYATGLEYKREVGGIEKVAWNPPFLYGSQKDCEGTDPKPRDPPDTSSGWMSFRGFPFCRLLLLRSLIDGRQKRHFSSATLLYLLL